MMLQLIHLIKLVLLRSNVSRLALSVNLFIIDWLFKTYTG